MLKLMITLKKYKAMNKQKTFKEINLTPKDYEEIMNLFDADDRESRIKAISLLFRGYYSYFVKLIKVEFIRNKNAKNEAEDMLQDTMVSLLTKNTKPTSKYAIHAWFRSYVYNITRDKLKRKYRQQEVSGHSDSGSSDESENDDVISRIMTDGGTEGTSISLECIKEVLRDFAANNPEGFLLHKKVKNEGYSYKELTKLFGKTVSNLKKIVSEVNTMLLNDIQHCL